MRISSGTARTALLACLLTLGFIVAAAPSTPVRASTDLATNSLPPLPTVFAGSLDGNVYALDAGTGLQVWRFATHGAILASPTVAGTHVYAGSDDGNIYALDTRTGAKIWQSATGGPIVAAPDVVHGIVYVASLSNSVHALDAGGNTLWSYATHGALRSAPSLVDGILYVGSDDHAIYAIDGRAGQKLWDFRTNGVVRATPAVSGDTVYAGSFDHAVYALDAHTGEELWKFATDGPIETSPVIAGHIVYAVSWDGNVYALDAITGAELWRFHTHARIRAIPLVVKGTVYVASTDGAIYALDARSGQVLWMFATGASVTASPTIVDGIVYVASDDGVIFALDAGTGKGLWSHPMGTLAHGTPSVSGGIVYAGSGLHDGRVFALSAQSGRSLWSFHAMGAITPRLALGTRAQTVVVKPPSWANPEGRAFCGAVYFPQTSHNMNEPFLSFYRRYGGVATFGYPRTSAFVEQGTTVQYTDRFRLEIGPRGQVVTTALGSALTRGRDFARPAPFVGTADSTFFTPTHHSLSGKFLAFWRTHNGLLLLGLPISEVVQEPATGGKSAAVSVQWFQKGRLDASAPDGVIQFGNLGLATLRQRGWL